MLGPVARCPSESLRKGVMVSVPGVAFAGIEIVSCIVIESDSGLENSAESARTTGPVLFNPRDRTLMAVLPITVTRIDLPTTAELPENGLRIFTSGGGTLPVAMIKVSTPELLPAPSSAVAVIVTGVPGGTERDEKRVKGFWKSVTALVNTVSKTVPVAPIAWTWMDFKPRLSFASVL